MSSSDYRPCRMTPLYDAIGHTITRVHDAKSREDNAMAAVTIITDGYENASREFSHTAIKALIESYKSEGWLFTYIGADHDVEKVSYSLAIDNNMQFDKTEEGTRRMFDKERRSRVSWMRKMSQIMKSDSDTREEKVMRMHEANKDYYEDDDDILGF